MSTFLVEQSLLSFQTVSIAAERSVAAHDAVTWLLNDGRVPMTKVQWLATQGLRVSDAA